MRIVLGGYLETGLVRFADDIIRPSRNQTGHPYYMCLNRRVPKSFFDRASTFVALADDVLMLSIDWALPPKGDGPSELSESALGVVINPPESFGGREHDEDTRAFVEILLRQRALSLESWTHVSTVDFDHLEFIASERALEQKRLRRQIAQHYLSRLFLQVRGAAESGARLVLSEPDIRVLREVGNFLVATRLPAPFSIPDVRHITQAEDFAAGLINFVPPDALTLSAVKRDPLIRKYVERVTPLLDQAHTMEGQRSLLLAMKETYEKAEAHRKVEKAFEIGSWIAKPLHYVPGLDAALSVAEDATDLFVKWSGREAQVMEWHLLGARMAEVSIRDYLARKDNWV